MPTYEYVCDVCGHTFDEFQSFSDEPLKKCPACGKNRLRRLFGTGSAILFKGSGFYQTDYRSESYKAGEKKERDAQKATDTTSSAATNPSSNGTTSAKPAETTTKSDSIK
jgi:putative FmdB family regulatory protein